MPQILIFLISSDKQKMWNEALSIHNKLRAIHGAPPMKLNNEMCKNAEEWSKKISTTFTHAPSAERAGDGENLAYSCQSQLPESLVKDAIKNWYVDDSLRRVLTIVRAGVTKIP